MRATRIVTAAAVAAALLGAGGTAAGAAGSPTCVSEFADVFGSSLANHGQHIVGDYVTGSGHDGEWPPAGHVGEVVGANRGAAAPGAPGIKLHAAAPGASFCTDSESPGVHI